MLVALSSVSGLSCCTFYSKNHTHKLKQGNCLRFLARQGTYRLIAVQEWRSDHRLILIRQRGTWPRHKRANQDRKNQNHTLKSKNPVCYDSILIVPCQRMLAIVTLGAKDVTISALDFNSPIVKHIPPKGLQLMRLDEALLGN